MFCPKCGDSTPEDVKYCRSCGLKLDKVAGILQTELVRLENENKFFNERFFRRLGFGFLFAFLGVGFAFAFMIAVYLKFIFMGAEMMAYFAVFGFVFLGFLSALFFGIQRYLGRTDVYTQEAAPNTSELATEMVAELEPGSHEPARSVIENTTELLEADVKYRR